MVRITQDPRTKVAQVVYAIGVSLEVEEGFERKIRRPHTEERLRHDLQSGVRWTHREIDVGGTGQANGIYDLGDFRSWVLGNPNHPVNGPAGAGAARALVPADAIVIPLAEGTER